MDIIVGLLAFIHPLLKMLMFVGEKEQMKNMRIDIAIHVNSRLTCLEVLKCHSCISSSGFFTFKYLHTSFKKIEYVAICYGLFIGSSYSQTFHLTSTKKVEARTSHIPSIGSH